VGLFYLVSQSVTKMGRRAFLFGQSVDHEDEEAGEAAWNYTISTIQIHKIYIFSFKYNNIGVSHTDT